MSDNEMTGGAEMVALVRDLMFGSRIRGAAPGVKLTRTAEQLVEAAGPATRLVIVELEAPGSVEAIGSVRERAPAGRVVAFAPHVMEETLTAAREAGAEVLTRGSFVKRLPDLVRESTGG